MIWIVAFDKNNEFVFSISMLNITTWNIQIKSRMC